MLVELSLLAAMLVTGEVHDNLQDRVQYIKADKHKIVFVENKSAGSEVFNNTVVRKNIPLE